MNAVRASFPALAVTLLCGGCTFEAGTGFGTMRDAVVFAAFEPGPARDLGDGALLTNLAYEVRLDRVEVEVDHVALQSLTGGGGGAAFDPAHPPPGYTLCHGGHCHAADGRLVDYADIAAELAGGGAAAFRDVVTVPVEEALDTLAGESVSLRTFEPSAELPEGDLSRVSVSVSRLTFEGNVTAGPEGGGLGEAAVPLRVDLPIAAALTQGIDRPVDRDAPASIRLSVGVVVGGTTFDDVDFAALVVGDEVVLGGVDEPGAEPILSAFAADELDVSID